MLGEKTAAAEPMALVRARVSLALIGAAVIGFVVPLLLGSAAATRRDAALERAADFYAEHPYLEAPLELMLDADDGPGNLAATALDPDAIAREQAELDAILAELDASEREAPAHRFGLARGAVSTASLTLHWLLHASWLQLLWNLGLLASAGARLELRLGRARYGALLFASSAAGALLHLVAGGSAPLVGLSAATAGIAGAFAVRPGDLAHDSLGPIGARTRGSPIRAAASIGAIVCAAAALLGVGSLGFAPLALLAGFTLGALAMFAFARAGWDAESAPLAREVAQALALLKAGSAPAALDLLRRRLATADDPQAARAFGLALRGRADAPEALSRELLAAIEAKRRQSAAALWREHAVHGAPPPRASAALHQLAAWLRGAGALGEARAAALASLADADARVAMQRAKEARRGDPVFALRAAEYALAGPGLSAAERNALEELLAQARKDAHNAGVVVLAAEQETAGSKRAAEPARTAASAAAPPQAEAVDLTAFAEDEGALDPEALAEEARGLAPEEPESSEAAESDAGSEAHDSNQAFFERGAIDLAAEEPAAPDLPDPEVAGAEALLDALHEALTTEAAHGGFNLDLEDGPEAPAQIPEDAAAPGTLSQDDGLGARPMELERTSVSPEAAAKEHPPARESAASSAALAMPAPEPSPDEFAFGEAADALFDETPPDEPPAPRLRALRVSEARPERLGREAIVLEIEGRGLAKLAYAKIDAVAAAGVRGLSASGKAVLVIDLVIGLAGEGDLRVVRLRADGFDPRTLVPGHSSPLAALRALVAELRERTHGAALPRESSAGAPFRIYADVASYEREAFAAEQK